jgi:light-regulated signal transduction histidine kinase (bacteriophytochrome)
MFVIFGVERAAFAGTFDAFLTLLHPGDRERVRVTALADCSRGALELDYRILWPDGSEHVVAARGSTHRNDDGVLVSMAGACWDITERRRSELAAADARAELGRSNTELEAFAYVASHDLQEPLRKVSSFCQLLKEQYGERLDETGLTYINYAVDGALRMKALIQDLLAYARVTANPYKAVPVNAALACGRALLNLQGAVEASGAIITRGGLPIVMANELQLIQLLQNLIGNALKFRGPAPPEVRIEAVNRPQDWLFSVQDNGIGIAPEYRARVFGIFQRLHPQSEYGGTGIGLAICKKIVEHWGGTIFVEPGAATGSKFCFTIPKKGTSTSGKQVSEPVAATASPN